MGSAEDGTPDVAPALSGSRSDLGVGEQDVDAAVVRQVEFYLSWRNLQADYYLKGRMTPDHWVPLQLIVDFPKMKNFQISSVENLARILKEKSTELEVNLSTFQVRPLFLVQDTKRSVLILREIPSGTSEQEIRDLFDGVEDCPPIYSIMPELENQWFVTFDTEKGAHLAFELTKTMHFKDKTVKARVKNNPTAGASYVEPGVLPVVELAQPNTPTYYAPPYYQRGGFAGPLPQDPVSAPVVTGAIPMVQHQRRASRGVLSPQPNHRSSPSSQARGQGPAGGVPVTAGGSERGTSSSNMRQNQRLSRQANASKGGRPKGKRNRYPEGGENRGSDSAAEKPKQDVSFTSTNFPPLGKEDTPQNEEKEPTEQKETREAKDTKDTKNTKDTKDTKEVKEPVVNVVKEAADKSSTPSAEKVANDVSAVVSDDDKRASRSSSESGANGSAKTYASILLAAKAAKQQVPVQDSPSPTQAHARLNDVASAQKEKESVTPPRDAPDPVKEEPKPETSGTNNLNTNQSVTAAEASGDSPDERGVADVKPEVTEETRPVSVWSNLPRSVLEAPSSQAQTQ